MQALSAIEAISPALVRTRRILFQPFRLGTFLKLCFVAALTEGIGLRKFNQSHVSHSSGNLSTAPFQFTPEKVAVIAAIALLVIAVLVALFYLVVRLRFALFQCLATQSTYLRPGWHLYRDQSRRFFLLSLVVALAFVVLAVGAVLPLALPIVHILRESRAAGHLLFGPLFSAMLPLLAVILGLVLIGIAADVVLRDLMLPHIALENATVAEAWSAVVDRISIEKGTFLLYGILRVMLPLGAAIGIFIVVAIPLIILFGVPGVLLAVLHAASVNAAGMPHAMLIGLEVVLGLLIVALAVLVNIAIGGPVGIAIREYALMFYGGRYDLLGEMLSPTPPPAEVTGLS